MNEILSQWASNMAIFYFLVFNQGTCGLVLAMVTVAIGVTIADFFSWRNKKY